MGWYVDGGVDWVRDFTGEVGGHGRVSREGILAGKITKEVGNRCGIGLSSFLRSFHYYCLLPNLPDILSFYYDLLPDFAVGVQVFSEKSVSQSTVS